MGLFNKKHSIGKTIAELRKEKGWTQLELAEKLQVSDKAVSKWEKDNGAPSVEFFPALAELFGVSIDYLMTGKMVEPEIITMSKIELCAKNDDVAIFESLSYEVLKTNDDCGKTILDYFLKYGSKQVLKAFFTKYPVKKIQEINAYKGGAPLWYTSTVIQLLITNNMVEELQSINAFERNVGRLSREWDIYAQEYQKLVLLDVNVSDEFKTYYFKSLNQKELNEILCFALDEKKEKEFALLWDIAENSNKILLNITTIHKLLDNGYVDIAKHANQKNKTHNVPFINEELIKATELKLKGGAEYEINRLSVIENGIVNIDKLLTFRDLKFVKNILNEYPIHFIEVLNEKKSDKKFLFRYAVDVGNKELADMVVGDNMNVVSRGVRTCGMNSTPILMVEMPKFDRWLLDNYWYNNQGNILNKAHLFLMKDGRKIDLIYAPNHGRHASVKSVEEVISKLQAVKQRIIDDLSLRLDKEQTIGDLTKEYFDKELAKRNFDAVIIKLCVRLEYILKNDYRYEGSFAEMLDKYCNEKLCWTDGDGWGGRDGKTINALNKLRMKRNNIVHAEQNSVDLSLEELQYCIDYICKLG